VHANPQPDRGERGALQLEGAGDGVGGAGECCHEAVTLTLFDGPHPVVFGDGR
jgi:hypothetical protein